MDDAERLETMQDQVRELNRGAEELIKLRDHVEALEEQLANQENAIKSYKPFRECRSINDVFNLFDSMEGRALAAEEQLKRELTT